MLRCPSVSSCKPPNTCRLNTLALLERDQETELTGRRHYGDLDCDTIEEEEEEEEAEDDDGDEEEE